MKKNTYWTKFFSLTLTRTVNKFSDFNKLFNVRDSSIACRACPCLINCGIGDSNTNVQICDLRSNRTKVNYMQNAQWSNSTRSEVKIRYAYSDVLILVTIMTKLRQRGMPCNIYSTWRTCCIYKKTTAPVCALRSHIGGKLPRSGLYCWIRTATASFGQISRRN